MSDQDRIGFIYAYVFSIRGFFTKNTCVLFPFRMSEIRRYLPRWLIDKVFKCTGYRITYLYKFNIDHVECHKKIRISLTTNSFPLLLLIIGYQKNKINLASIPHV